MGLDELDIKVEYRSLLQNVAKSFLVPTLRKATSYDRAVGFFSSSSLVHIAYGIEGLALNGGKIRLIASPKLSDEDVEAIKQGYADREALAAKALNTEIEKPVTVFEKEKLNLLANLIKDDILDIKIAFVENKAEIGIYHEKLGIIKDDCENTIAFSGSMNESDTAYNVNYEAIDVFCSWKSDDQCERVRIKVGAFESIWNDLEPGIMVMDFPETVKENLLKNYYYEKVDYDKVPVPEVIEDFNIVVPNYSGAVIPKGFKLHDYQKEAIAEWVKRGYRGIFDMATGTGKTYTGLGAIAELNKHVKGHLAVIIVCPYQHLVEQWVEDIVRFNMKPIICYSASSQKNWKERLKNSVISFCLGVQDFFCMVSTNATFSSDYVQSQIFKLTGNVVLVVDEAHNFGANNLSRTLMPHIPYRLALSATIDRYGDNEGTKKLYDYFGGKCIEYTLKKAIENHMLTPYYYYPLVVTLNNDELQEYIAITKSIGKNMQKKSDGSILLSEYVKMLLIKRARLVAGAKNKLTVLKDNIEKYKNDSHILVYCGATTLHDVEYEEGKTPVDEAKQIDVVANLLGNNLGMRISKFTSEESSEERELIKRDFSEGKHLQALVAIRCLDEGVNIPSIKTAFIMASSTNPKEYIQRRGRVLRISKGKSYAVIYDFITLPIDLDSVNEYDADVIDSVKSLAKREIIRMKDFAEIAENPYDSDILITNIQREYDFDIEDIKEDLYV